MIFKIAFEIVIAIALFILSVGFWACAKSPKFMQQILADYEKLKRAVANAGKDSIIKHAEQIEPLHGSFSNNIAISIYSGIGALDKARNIQLFVIIVLIIGSYFLGWGYLLSNVFIVIALSFSTIPESAQKNVVSDLFGITIIIYKWNSINPKECAEFCDKEKPMLRNLYKAVNEVQ